MYIYHK
jgi:cAMP-specific phosphodiesterase 4